MPKMDLRQNYRRGGVLYRAGKGVEVPDHIAQWIRGEGPKAPGAFTVGSTATVSLPSIRQGAEGLPEGYLYRDILDGGGFKSHQAVQDASDEALLALDGIGPARLRELRAFEPV